MTKRRHLLLASLAFALACTAPEPGPFDGLSAPEPMLFAPGAVSTDAEEFGITFTPDGREAYFTRRLPRQRQKIYVSRFENGAWTPGERTPFSNDIDETPFITQNGTRFFFASRRPTPRWPNDPSDNLWVMDRVGDGWGQPYPLPGEVNQPRPEGMRWPNGSEVGPVFVEPNTLLFWSAGGFWGSGDILVSREEDGVFLEPEPLGFGVNTPGIESNPAVSPDTELLLFQGYRATGAIGAEDLFLSRWDGDGWSAPQVLPEPINTRQNEGFPAFSPDGRFFFFASDRHAGEGDWSIYYMETSALIELATRGSR